jgi:hypothetical protein
MPFAYRIDAEKRRVLTTGSGTFTYLEAITLIQRMRDDPEFKPSYTELTDLTAVGNIDMTMEQIVELAQIRVFDRESKRAIVAPNPLYFGMARMYESHHEASSGGVARVFSDLSEAVLWLDGTTPPQPGPARPRNSS